MKKNKNLLSTITDFIFTLVFIAITIGTFYFIDVINKSPDISIEVISKKKSSKIYDINDNFVKQLTVEDYEDIKYEDLPDVFINALLSCEDVRYFTHNGIDIPRLLSALKNDVLSLSLKEGASTITQQLVKNMMLTNTKSVERKIQEAYLSNKIEKLYSKKEILEFYCNYVCFDGVNHGIQSASYNFFNKSISDVTLPEAALLAGVVNAPSAYNPFKNQDKANERKDVVLSLMYRHGFINNKQYINAKSIKIEDMLYHKDNNKLITYPYQAYIDVCYKQIYEKTNLDPYLIPMEIYTNMDLLLQEKIDKLQQSDSFIIDELQQFASTVINNKTGAISAVFAGKNYNGVKLLNRAYDCKYQPASTISYALAFEHLNYCNQEILLDKEITYPNSNITINNVDKTYQGDISIIDAIGLSKNTTAILTLEKIIDKIGIYEVVEYLKSINLMDDGEFSYSYGLGGYSKGVSVTALAAAYSMIARLGVYIEPLAVRKIKLLDGSNKEIIFSPSTKRVLSEESCFLLCDVLEKVMNLNYYSIKNCKPKDVYVYAKTGTSSFDKSTIEKLNYPTGVSKDKWLASFSSDYSIACWSGFDKHLKDRKTYFTNNDTRSDVLKTFTKNIYQSISIKNKKILKPDGIVEANIVKGSNLLATNQVNPSYIIKALYKKDYEPKSYFQEPTIEEKVEFDYFILNDEITFIFNDSKDENHLIYDVEKILNGKHIYIDIYENGHYINTEKAEKIKTIKLNDSFYSFDIYYKYGSGLLDGVKSNLKITYN